MSAKKERVRGWPVGPALLQTLGDLNHEVDEALAEERARLRAHGYPGDLPLPALWWTPTPGTTAPRGPSSAGRLQA